jgi:hypothetical protein
MKTFLKGLVVLVVVLLIAVMIVWLVIDSLAKSAIEKGGTYALGVQTTADNVSLGILDGALKVDGLTIANPVGYKSPFLLKTGHFDLQVQPKTILEDTVDVTKFEVQGAEVYLEQETGRSNASIVLDNLKRLDTGPKKPGEGGKKVRVDTITIRDVTAHVQILPIGGGKASDVTVQVPLIELKGVTGDNAQGLVIGEVAARILPAILAAILEKGGTALPAEFREGLTNELTNTTKALGEGAAKVVGQVGGAFGDLFKKPAGEGAGQKSPLKDIGEGLKELFGGKKPEGQP